MTDIMNADKYGIDHNTEELIVDAGSAGNKQGIDASIMNADKESALS